MPRIREALNDTNSPFQQMDLKMSGNEKEDNGIIYFNFPQRTMQPITGATGARKPWPNAEHL